MPAYWKHLRQVLKTSNGRKRIMKRSKIGIALIIIIVLYLAYANKNPDTWLHTFKFPDSSTETISAAVTDSLNKITDLSDVAGEATDKFLSIFGYSNEDANEPATDLIPVTLNRVVDGDTITVLLSDGTEKKIRLLSINAEESVSNDTSKNNEYGQMASDFLKEYLSDTTEIWLQYDTNPQDQYGRELCYVWLSENVDVTSKKDIENKMLNAILLKEGYVYTVIYEPNSTYKDIFYEIEDEARKSNDGLWGYEEFQRIRDSKK